MVITDFRGAQLVLVFDGKVDVDLVRRIESVFGSRDPGGDLGYGGTREDTGWRLRAISGRAELVPDLVTSSRHTLVAHLSEAVDAQALPLPSCKSSVGLPETNAASVVVRLSCMSVDPDTGKKRPPSRNDSILEGAGDWEPAVRRDFVGLWLLAQAIRITMNDLKKSEQKLRLFISHAKLDGVPLALAIRGQVSMLGALRDFYDVEDLDQKGNIDKQLRKAVFQSAVIALRSDCYDERPWCRWEVERAEEYGCPVLVVDARTRLTHPASSLAYACSPGVRIPDGNTLRILAETLRLSLRTAMARRRLKDAGESSVVFIPRTPSILSLMRACERHKNARRRIRAPLVIVHPDPPLERGAWEAAQGLVRQYSPDGRVSTVAEHLVRVSAKDPKLRPLTGLKVGLSISEPENLKALGFSKPDIDRFIVRFAETLLGLGARLVFGHDWRHGGVMETVSEAAIRYRPLVPGPDSWSIQNLVPWPDPPALESWRRDQIKDVIEIEQAGLPQTLAEWQRIARLDSLKELPKAPEAKESDELKRRWGRAVALSHLRARLNEACDARVCLGGKLEPWSKERNPSGHQGWFPGVMEEAFHALRSSKPLFVGGLFGGSAQQMAEALDQDEAAQGKGDQDGYAPHVTTAEDLISAVKGVTPFSPKEWWGVCKEVKQAAVLSDDDRKRLHQTKDMEEFLLLVVKGLVKLKKPKFDE